MPKGGVLACLDDSSVEEEPFYVSVLPSIFAPPLFSSSTCLPHISCMGQGIWSFRNIYLVNVSFQSWPHFHVPALLIISLSLQHCFLFLLLQLVFLKFSYSVTGLDLNRKLWVHLFLKRQKRNKTEKNQCKINSNESFYLNKAKCELTVPQPYIPSFLHRGAPPHTLKVYVSASSNNQSMGQISINLQLFV